MSKAQVTDIVLLAFISGVVAILTSMMGISGTIIGAVVTSLIAESLKAYFKEPIKDKIKELEYENRTSEIDYNIKNKQIDYAQRNNNDSYITAKMLFLFPLIVILIIELIHFLGAIHLIPYDIFLSLESLTNWRLLRTIGYALIIMGIYPLVSKKFGTQHGIILIIVGIIELIFGYADANTNAYIITSLLSSLREYVNIAIILAILYTVLTIPDEVNEKNIHRF